MAEDTTLELKNLLTGELEDFLHAENQLVKFLPKLAKAAHSPRLRQVFQDHLEETDRHLERLRRAFELLGTSGKPKPCKGMQGLIEGGEETIQETKGLNPASADLALIIATQKIKHYEISGYGSVRVLAERIGEAPVARLLGEAHDDENKLDELLTQTSQPLFTKAA